MPPTPELIAHRGASAERPENTVAAFVRAVALGAGAVELDVHLSADGYLVVHHDPVVADGPRQAAIASLTLADLQAFRVRGEPIPTLADVVAAIGGRVRIYCELKGAGTAEPAVRLLAPLGDGAAVHSFDHRMIAEAGRLAPEVPRGVLETSYHRDPTFPVRDVGARDLWQHAVLIDRGLIDATHAAGARVIAWTVNDPARAVELAAWGCDGVCTDDVAAIGAALGRPGAR